MNIWSWLIRKNWYNPKRVARFWGMSKSSSWILKSVFLARLIVVKIFNHPLLHHINKPQCSALHKSYRALDHDVVSVSAQLSEPFSTFGNTQFVSGSKVEHAIWTQKQSTSIRWDVGHEDGTGTLGTLLYIFAGQNGHWRMKKDVTYMALRLLGVYSDISGPIYKHNPFSRTPINKHQ